MPARNIPRTPAQSPKRRPRGRPTHADAVLQRESFLAIALEVFLKEGYVGSSMEGIARRAKISKNTVYLQYRTKNELFRAAALRGLESVRVELGTSIRKGTSIETGLLSIIERVQKLAADQTLRDLARLLIAESLRFPDIAAAMLQEVDHLFEPIADYLKHANARGLLEVPDPVAGARHLAMLAMGGFHFLLAEPPKSRAVIKARAEEVLTLLRRSWAASRLPAAQTRTARRSQSISPSTVPTV